MSSSRYANLARHRRRHNRHHQHHPQPGWSIDGNKGIARRRANTQRPWNEEAPPPLVSVRLCLAKPGAAAGKAEREGGEPATVGYGSPQSPCGGDRGGRKGKKGLDDSVHRITDITSQRYRICTNVRINIGLPQGIPQLLVAQLVAGSIPSVLSNKVCMHVMPQGIPQLGGEARCRIDAIGLSVPWLLLLQC